MKIVLFIGLTLITADFVFAKSSIVMRPYGLGAKQQWITERGTFKNFREALTETMVGTERKSLHEIIRATIKRLHYYGIPVAKIPPMTSDELVAKRIQLSEASYQRRDLSDDFYREFAESIAKHLAPVDDRRQLAVFLGHSDQIISLVSGILVAIYLHDRVSMFTDGQNEQLHLQFIDRLEKMLLDHYSSSEHQLISLHSNYLRNLFRQYPFITNVHYHEPVMAKIKQALQSTELTGSFTDDWRAYMNVEILDKQDNEKLFDKSRFAFTVRDLISYFQTLQDIEWQPHYLEELVWSVYQRDKIALVGTEPLQIIDKTNSPLPPSVSLVIWGNDASVHYAVAPPDIAGSWQLSPTDSRRADPKTLFPTRPVYEFDYVGDHLFSVADSRRELEMFRYFSSGPTATTFAELQHGTTLEELYRQLATGTGWSQQVIEQLATEQTIDKVIATLDQEKLQYPTHSSEAQTINDFTAKFPIAIHRQQLIDNIKIAAQRGHLNDDQQPQEFISGDSKTTIFGGLLDQQPKPPTVDGNQLPTWARITTAQPSLITANELESLSPPERLLMISKALGAWDTIDNSLSQTLIDNIAQRLANHQSTFIADDFSTLISPEIYQQPLPPADYQKAMLHLSEIERAFKRQLTTVAKQIRQQPFAFGQHLFSRQDESELKLAIVQHVRELREQLSQQTLDEPSPPPQQPIATQQQNSLPAIEPLTRQLTIDDVDAFLTRDLEASYLSLLKLMKIADLRNPNQLVRYLRTTTGAQFDTLANHLRDIEQPLDDHTISELQQSAQHLDNHRRQEIASIIQKIITAAQLQRATTLQELHDTVSGEEAELLIEADLVAITEITKEAFANAQRSKLLKNWVDDRKAK